MKKRKTIYWVLASCTVATVGFVVVPPIVKKISAKLYKADLRKEEIDFENLGPEIVKKEPACLEGSENGN